MSVPVLPVDRRRAAPANGRRTAAADGRRTTRADRRRHSLTDRRRRAGIAEVCRSRAADPDELDLEALLDELVRGLFDLGLGIAGAMSQLEGPVADRLSTVLEDADRLVRTVRSAAVAVRTDST